MSHVGVSLGHWEQMQTLSRQCAVEWGGETILLAAPSVKGPKFLLIITETEQIALLCRRKELTAVPFDCLLSVSLNSLEKVECSVIASVKSPPSKSTCELETKQEKARKPSAGCHSILL